MKLYPTERLESDLSIPINVHGLLEAGKRLIAQMTCLKIVEIQDSQGLAKDL